MSSLAMETHEFIKELTVSGFTEHQAETIARHQALIINENLATKQDIELLNQGLALSQRELGQGFEQSQQELRQDFEQTQRELRQDIERSLQELRQDFERSLQELRQDFERSQQELKQDFALSKQELKQDMVLLKKELLIKLGMTFIGGWVATMGIILGVMSVMLK